MQLQTAATIVGLLTGVVGLVSATLGVIDKYQTTFGKKRAPVSPYQPPVAPPTGYYPRPGGAPPLTGYPQLGNPAPRGGYPVQPQGQWGYPQQPGAYPAAPQPQPVYVPPYLPVPARRRWITYPWIALGAAGFFIVGGLYTSAGGGNGNDSPTAVAILLVALVIYVPTVIYAARDAARLQRWGWFTSIVLLFGYGVLAFGIFGPTTPPRRV